MRWRLLKPLFGFLTWWGGFFALLAGGSVCPCCGTTTCPGGAASAGILGGLAALLLHLPRWVVRVVRGRPQSQPSLSPDREPAPLSCGHVQCQTHRDG
jgi:hypothetical protein